ncbi:MAG: glycosyltransferase family 39 protein [Chloroflexota bacterium]|nr:glycosyltransferase family 39 protein [Chloroflexota bacterium]
MLYRQSWWEQARTCAARLAGSRQNVACNIKAWCVARSSAISAVLVAFLLTRVTIGAVIAVSLVYIKLDPTMPVPQGAPPILWGLLRWDSLHLAHIVQYGYDRGRTPFFPLYPLLVKGLSLLVGNVFVAGLLLSHIALVVALFYLYALAQDTYDAATARRAVFYLAAAPAAVFFSAMYKESLFVALATATLYHARKQQWIRAGLAGALAAAAHDTGVLLKAVIAVEALCYAGVRLSWTLRVSRVAVREQGNKVAAALPGLAAAAAVPIGLLAYMGYQAYALGDPLAFLHAEARWGRSLSPFSVMRLIPGSLTVSGAFDLLATLLFIPLVVGVVCQKDTAATVFTVAVFLLPLCTGQGTYSMTRFTLELIPCFVLLGRWGRHVWAHRIIIALSLPTMIYISVLYSHWAGPA